MFTAFTHHTAQVHRTQCLSEALLLNTDASDCSLAVFLNEEVGSKKRTQPTKQCI